MRQLSAYMIAAVMAAGLAGPVMAAPSAPANEPATPAATHPNPGDTQASTPIRQQGANDLMKAGFTDIKVMPESFLVRAKDPKGNPVMMVINPDSFTAVTEIATPKTTASASNTGAKSGNSVLSGPNANGDPTPPAKQ